MFITDPIKNRIARVLVAAAWLTVFCGYPLPALLLLLLLWELLSC